MEEEHSNENKGIVKGIFISRQKGRIREQIEEGYFKEDIGLIGDIKSGKSEKQVAILGIESRRQIEEHAEIGVCTNRFHETISTKNIELYRFPVGTRFKIGETLHEITHTGKTCFDECELVRKKSKCSLSSQVVFTKVLVGGIIKVGDLIHVQ